MSGELSTGLDLLNTLLAPLAPEAVDTSSLPLPSGGIGPMTHSIDHLSTQPEPTNIDQLFGLLDEKTFTASSFASFRAYQLEDSHNLTRDFDKTTAGTSKRIHQ
ncbi:hypothetical protein Pst134EA_009536 [Puccinia striiformis f. sp. tritici]|uniref:hypothetical protein n=1 Tax=Puccinia striiformis f. sp. tritici TaxID=168172 RepID=UPI0020079C62|nr:hypothetical protein Pst134EA_009536 [Puccinia striiformis f. sp. tritici]KAH9469015.1 hypothetical protein Pst134EA_009536 [Puccinia striiformis f. sp. tritici]